jgi:hypothetical protein
MQLLTFEVNTLPEDKLCEQSLISVYFVCSESTDNILMWIYTM